MNLDCPHFKPGCSGCVIDQNLGHPPLFDEVHTYFKTTLNYDASTIHGNLKGWRYRAKLAVRGSFEDPLVGLFKEGTHDVLDIPLCQVQHPTLNKAADILREWIKEQQIIPYNEITGKGELRYLQLTYEKKTNLAQVVLVLNQEINPDKLSQLWVKGRGIFHSLWSNLNSKRTNKIWGDVWDLLYGEEWLAIPLLGHEYYFHPAAFIQANPEMFEALLVDLHQHLLKDKKIVEYYAGVGVIGLSTLAMGIKSLILSELNPMGKKCFKKNLNYFPQELQKKAVYHELNAAKGATFLTDAEIVIVDPPRKGMEPGLLHNLIAAKKVEQLIYISCGWESFKKESALLIENGFTLTFAKGYLFFPGTNHIETLAIFSR